MRHLRTAFPLAIAAGLLLAAPGAVRADEAEAASEEVAGKVPVVILDGPILERKEPTDVFGQGGTTLGDLRATFHKAAMDADVKALVLKIEGPQLGMAQLVELRGDLAAFRESGKELIVTTDFLTMGRYMLASVADHLVIPPAGGYEAAGISLDMYFYAGILEKLGIKADVVKIGKFKSAMEAFTNTEMSEGTRIQLQAILDDVVKYSAETVGDSRGIDVEKAKELLFDGPYRPDEALELGLVTDVEYPDDFLVDYAEANNVEFDYDYDEKDSGKKKTNLFELFMGGGVGGAKKITEEPHVAVIYAQGPLIDGRVKQGPFGSEQAIASEDFLDMLEEVYENEGTSAIVMRVDSPGGSANASDRIWNRLRQFSDDDIPVVVSMGNVAASGGYYISMGADHIVAQPLTITGSIGVIGGRFVMAGTYEKIGMTKQSIATGRHAALWDETKPWTEDERGVIKAMMDQIYDQFTAKAAEGRGMEQERIKELGGGRVWTGMAALDNGLVDELGGLELAITRAKELAGLPEDAEVVEYPRELTLAEFFEKMFSVQARSMARGQSSTSTFASVYEAARTMLPHQHLTNLATAYELFGQGPNVALYEPVTFDIH